MYQMIAHQNTVTQVATQIWRFLCSKSSGPVIILIMGITSTTWIFTQMEVAIMFGVFSTVAIVSFVTDSLIGKDPSGILQVASAGWVKSSVVCSICISVQLLSLSILFASVAVAISSRLQEDIYQKAVRFCSFTGGDAIWGPHATSVIPIATLTHLLLYAPFMPFTAVSIVTMRIFLAISWHSYQFETHIDEWIHQLLLAFDRR